MKFEVKGIKQVFCFWSETVSVSVLEKMTPKIELNVETAHLLALGFFVFFFLKSEIVSSSRCCGNLVTLCGPVFI